MDIKRPSTFNWWVQEKSGEVKNISVEQFLRENPGYTSDYTNTYNIISSAGCKLCDGAWVAKDGRRFDNVFEALEYLKMRGII